MTEYNFIEKIFCGRPIADGNTCTGTNDVLGQKITELQTDVQNLEREKQEIITGAGLTKKECLEQIDALNVQITGLNTKIAELNIQLNQNAVVNPLYSTTFANLPTATQTLALQYYNKYPEAYVTYGGRVWGVGRTKYNLDVKVWCLAGQNDQAINALLNECNGKVSKVLQENPNLTFHQACDISVMRIHAKIASMVSYAYDSQTWGEAEFWQMSFESLAGKLGDCEDLGILNFVACRTAGIPSELLRLVAGMTFSNEGHCTNFYMSSDLSFHHVNSTTNYSATKDVKTLPLPGDSSESLNIQHVWFASTDYKTFNWFTTEAKAAIPSMKNDGFLKWLHIFDKNGKKVV